MCPSDLVECEDAVEDWPALASGQERDHVLREACRQLRFLGASATPQHRADDLKPVTHDDAEIDRAGRASTSAANSSPGMAVGAPCGAG